MSMQEMAAVITRFQAATDALAALGARLGMERGDIGTGVGLLAVSAARVWPECAVTGIDVWEPSLELARRNVTAAGLGHRIEIRRQDVLDLDDADRYDCVWLPSFFFGPRFSPRRSRRSLMPRCPAAMSSWRTMSRRPTPCHGPRCACAPSATAGPCSTRTARPNCCAAPAARTCTR